MITIDKELESLIKTGYSKKYSNYTGKCFQRQLSAMYMLLDSVEGIDELRKFKSVELYEISPSIYSIHLRYKKTQMSLNIEIQEGKIILKNLTTL